MEPRVCVVGHKNAAIACAGFLKDLGHLACVVTQPSWQGDFVQWCDDRRVPCLIGSPNLYADQLGEMDYIFCLQYRYKFGRRLLTVPCINMHYSLLPRHAGCHTLRHVIDSGDRVTGLTFHEMTENYDDGDILWQAMVQVESDEFQELHRHMTKLAISTFPFMYRALIEGRLTPTKQDLSQQLYHHREAA